MRRSVGGGEERTPSYCSEAFTCIFCTVLGQIPSRPLCTHSLGVHIAVTNALIFLYIHSLHCLSTLILQWEKCILLTTVCKLSHSTWLHTDILQLHFTICRISRLSLPSLKCDFKSRNNWESCCEIMGGFYFCQFPEHLATTNFVVRSVYSNRDKWTNKCSSDLKPIIFQQRLYTVHVWQRKREILILLEGDFNLQIISAWFGSDLPICLAFPLRK